MASLHAFFSWSAKGLASGMPLEVDLVERFVVGEEDDLAGELLLGRRADAVVELGQQLLPPLERVIAPLQLFNALPLDQGGDEGLPGGQLPPGRRAPPLGAADRVRRCRKRRHGRL